MDEKFFPEENSPKVNNTLTAGVAPDGLKDSMSIKVFVCCLINEFKDTLVPEDIIEISFEHSLANYFEICSAIDELLSSGLILKDSETGILSLSHEGQLAAEGLYKDVPVTVREKAANAVNKRIERKLHEQETQVEITPLPDGCRLSCTLLGSSSPLMSVSLYLPDEKYAKAAKERFIDDPEYIYRVILSHLTGNNTVAPECIE